MLSLLHPVRVRYPILPLRRFTESASAGFPSAAVGYEDEPLDLHDYVVRNAAATFFMSAAEDLFDEHIRRGSVLVVDKSLAPAAGKLVVVELHGGSLCGECRPPVPVSWFSGSWSPC